MNPNVDTAPGMGLPEPQPANAPLNPEQVGQTPPNPEYSPVGSPEAGGQAPAVPSFAVPQAPSATPPQATGTAVNPALATPTVADDGDLIEKEWVVKAKQIVSSTKQDPYQQNRQLAAFKADYLQKRYGKAVKLSE
jgi:hypothetical protein